MSRVVTHRIALRRLTVARVEDLGPHLRRVVLVGDELQPFTRGGFDLPGFITEAPDDHIKVFPPGPNGEEPNLPGQGDGKLDWPEDRSVTHRDYTVRRYDATAGELTVDFVVHEGGVASAWAVSAKPGDALHVAGPRSSVQFPAASEVVLAGDLTALPAIARWVEEAPKETTLTVLIQAFGEDDRIELRRIDGSVAEVTWLLGGETLVDAVQALPALGEDIFVFAAGELSQAAAIRVHLRDDRGLTPSQFKTANYWRAGSESGEDHLAVHELAEKADLLTPFAIRVAATLRLADHIDDGATTYDALIAATQADGDTLTALVQHLSHIGLLNIDNAERLSLTVLGAALLDSDESELRRQLDLTSAEGRMAQAWAGLLHTTQTGESGYAHLYGRPFWDDVSDNVEFARSMDGYLARWAFAWVPLVRDQHNWAQYRHLVDVGGGMGLLLADLLAHNPELTGTLLELESPVESSRWLFDAQGVTDRATGVVGSFFDELPNGDALILAQVLHNWPDEQCVEILKRCADALDDDGRVLVLERIRAGRDDGHAEMTLRMRTLFAGSERTVEGLSELAAGAGLVFDAATPIGFGLQLVSFAASEQAR